MSNNKPDMLHVVENHMLTNNEDYIFMDINTMEVYVLDHIEGEIVKTINKFPETDRIEWLKDIYGETAINKKITTLLENGILTNGSKQNNIAADIKHAEDKIDIIQSMNISISEDCNLSCKYCFVKNGNYHGKKDLMNPEIGKKSIDFLIQRSGEQKDLFISFFGGEPLINYNVLKEIVYYCREKERKLNKRFHFSITTNGMLLDDKVVAFLGKQQISVLISIDGDIYSHNLNRPVPGGEGSYSQIINNLKRLDKKNIKYSARVTVSSLTKNKIAQNFKHLFSLGFKRIHFENALAPKGKIFITNEKDAIEIKDQYVKTSREIELIMQSNQPYTIEMFPFPLGKIDIKRKAFFPCSAGRGRVAVGINGDLFLCHRFVGDQDFWIGNVVKDIYSSNWSETIMQNLYVDKRENCKECWARYLCGGGCYAVNYEFNKNISESPNIYCDLKKNSIEQALIIWANTAL